MENLYVKTVDFELEDFLNFCLEKYEEYEFDYDDIQRQKTIIRESYPHANIFILNEKAQVIAIDDQDIRTKSGDIIWTEIDIELLNIWDVEYFDLKKFNHVVDYGYEVVEAGLNTDHNWVFLKAESLKSHYRSYLFNLQNIKNLVAYIRERKIERILS